MIWICAALAADVIAVLPFESNAVRPELLPLGAATTDMLVTDLSRVPGAVVVERSRINAVLAELQLQSSGFVDPETAVRVGQGLGANLVVVGSVNTASVGLRIDARLVDVSTGQVALGASSTGAEEDFFDLESDVARQLYAHFGAAVDVTGSGKPVTLADAVEGGTRIQGSDEAYFAMLKGVQTYRRERLYRTTLSSEAYVIQRGAGGAPVNLYELVSAGLVEEVVHRKAVRRTRIAGWGMLAGGTAVTAGGTALFLADEDVGAGFVGGVVLTTLGGILVIGSVSPLALKKKRITVPAPRAFPSPADADHGVEAHNRALAESLSVPERRRLEIEAERVAQ